MYKEFRAEGLTETISKTSPEAWGQHFLNNPGLSLYQYGSFLFDKRWSLIKRFVPKGSKILDAGCGAGEWIEFLSKNGYTGIGIDYSSALIDKLKQAKPEYSWIHGVIQKIPVNDGEFDAIISWGVIEHDEKGPSEALCEFYRVLKTNGILIVTVPNDCRATRLASSEMFPQEKVKHKDGSFFQYYMETHELSDFVKQAGFTVEHCESISGPSLALFWPRLYKRVINKPLVFRALNLLVKLLVPSLRSYDHNVICIARKK